MLAGIESEQGETRYCNEKVLTDPKIRWARHHSGRGLVGSGDSQRASERDYCVLLSTHVSPVSECSQRFS